MAAKRKISDFNQSVIFQEIQEIDTPDGNGDKAIIDRFTALANIKPINTTQAYANGVDEADTKFNMMIWYDPTREIKITDRIVWDGKICKPVGESTIDDYGSKRVIKQTIKYSATN